MERMAELKSLPTPHSHTEWARWTVRDDAEILLSKRRTVTAGHSLANPSPLSALARETRA